MKGRIAGQWIFTWGQSTVTSTSLPSAATFVPISLLIFFAVETTALTDNDFQWGHQTQKIALSPWGIWTPIQYMVP